MPLEFTAKGYIEVWRNGEKLSQHHQEREAVEAISGFEPGTYRVTYPDVEVVSRLIRVIRDVDVTRPNTPTGLAGTPVSETQIDLSWNVATDPQGALSEAQTGVAGYKLYRDSVLRVTQGGTTFSDTGLSAYTQYSYQVTSYDAAGNESVLSTSITPRTLDTTAPTAPTITASETGQTTLSVALTTPSSDAGSGVSTYRLEYKTSAASTWTLDSASLTAGQFPRTIAGLTAGTAYDTRCRATDVSGNTGSFSATSSATTQSSQGTLPLGTLTQDAETPEQIALYLPITDTLDEAYTAAVRFRLATIGVWQDAPNLWRVEPEYALTSPAPPITLSDAFAGTIFIGPNAIGNSYDVEVTVSNGSTSQIVEGTFACRSLPRVAGTVTHSVSTLSALNALTNGGDLSPGDVVEFDGELDCTSGPLILHNISGTAANPIFIRGASVATAILSRSTVGLCIDVENASHVVLEQFTVEGPGTDPAAGGVVPVVRFWDGASGQTNICFRRMVFDGVCSGITNTAITYDCLVYDCLFLGTNTWDLAHTESSITWNDDGVRLGGVGCCVFNCEFYDFGDSVSFRGENDNFEVSACFQYRNKVVRSCDDAFEAEYCTRNCGVYDNYTLNAMTALSIDGVFGGPLYYFRNRCINFGRTIFKCGEWATGVLIWANTFVKTTGVSTDAGGVRAWYWSGAAVVRDWEYRNNMVLWEGANDIMRFDHASSLWTPWRCDHNGWSRNSQNIHYAAAGLPVGNVATVNAALTPIHDDDVELTNQAAVLETSVVFGSDYLTEVSTEYTLALKASSEAEGQAATIPTISEHGDLGAYGYGEAPPTVGVRGAPDWALALDIDAWTAVAATNDFDDVKAASVGQYGEGEPARLFTAWNGFALVPDHGAHGTVAAWGGGHKDYYGNEVYSFDLATLTWARRNDPYIEPSGFAGPFTDGLLSNGTPNVPHTRYQPWGRGTEMWQFSRQINNNPQTGFWPTMFNLATNTWEVVSTQAAPTNTEGVTYDASRGVFWSPRSDTLRLHKYVVSTDTWSTEYSSGTAFVACTGPAYIPSEDLIVHVAYNVDVLEYQVLAYDAANPAAGPTALSTTGTPPDWTHYNFVGDMIRYSANLNAIVVYLSRQDKIHLLDVSTLAWSERTLSGNSGPHDGTTLDQPTYGKFILAEWDDVTVGMVFGSATNPPKAVRLQ